MSKLKGIVMERKQREPYVEMSHDDMMSIFGGDPALMAAGGPGQQAAPSGFGFAGKDDGPHSAPQNHPNPGGGMPGGPGGAPGGGPPMFAKDENASAAIIVDHGKLDTEKARTDGMGTTPYSEKGADGIQIITCDGSTGGVYCTGEGTDFLLENAVISIAGNGPDGALGGMSTGVEATDHAKVTIKNCDITASGVSRSTTMCQNYGEMRIYDSSLIAHGAPWGSSKREHRESAKYREFEGNARNHCTMANGKTWFYNCKIYTDGWAAVSTDAAQGFVYVEANDCDIRCRSGYAAYADNGCHDVFNRCTIQTGAMGAVLAGECSIQYNGCKVDCGTYFIKVHCVMGRPIELGYAEVNGCDVVCGSTALLARSANAEFIVRSSKIVAKSGDLLKAEVNSDPCATDTKGKEVYGVHGTFENCNLTGNIAGEDPTRSVYAYLENTALTGAIKNAYLTLDENSSWTADADSELTIVGEFELAQIDAPAGVTITAKAGESGKYALASGGKLVLVA